MNPTTTQTFNEILKTIQASKQKALQNEKLSTSLRELAYNIEHKGENNAA